MKDIKRRKYQNYFMVTRIDIVQGQFLKTGQGVSRTNSTPAGRAESEITATVRHPKILICLFLVIITLYRLQNFSKRFVSLCNTHESY
jgi:hypothetical protein